MLWPHLWKSMYEEHERLGAVTSCDIVELDPIGGDILVTTKTAIQQTVWRNCRTEVHIGYRTT